MGSVSPASLPCLSPPTSADNVAPHRSEAEEIGFSFKAADGALFSFLLSLRSVADPRSPPQTPSRHQKSRAQSTSTTSSLSQLNDTLQFSHTPLALRLTRNSSVSIASSPASASPSTPLPVLQSSATAHPPRIPPLPPSFPFASSARAVRASQRGRRSLAGVEEGRQKRVAVSRIRQVNLARRLESKEEWENAALKDMKDTGRRRDLCSAR